MPRPSKDIARRLRFERRPTPDTFRRWYAVCALLAVALGFVLWFAMSRKWGERSYLPGAVTTAHAMFGERCNACHAPYAAVADASCLRCHTERFHSEFDPAPAPCRSCHAEHRGGEALAGVAAAPCVDCHAALVSKRQNPAVRVRIASFAEHPEVVPLRPPAKDRAALRFNHYVHFKAKLDEKLKCETCHQYDGAGRRMRPISFESDCQRCHALDVEEEIGAVAVPHPECRDAGSGEPCDWFPVQREKIRTSLIQLAIASPEDIFQGRKILLPGVPSRGPVDESNSLSAYLDRWTKIVEKKNYKPLNSEKPLYANNEHRCALCHLEAESSRSEAGIPVFQPTSIPRRWLQRGEFHHQRHAMVKCETCHGDVRQSKETSDVNLPPIAVCQHCHIDGQPGSAGVECSLCHRYHDTSKDRALFAQRRLLRKARLEELLREVSDSFPLPGEEVPAQVPTAASPSPSS